MQASPIFRGRVTNYDKVCRAAVALQPPPPDRPGSVFAGQGQALTHGLVRLHLHAPAATLAAA